MKYESYMTLHITKCMYELKTQMPSRYFGPLVAFKTSQCAYIHFFTPGKFTLFSLHFLQVYKIEKQMNC